jgi:hypothetical protein
MAVENSEGREARVESSEDTGDKPRKPR